MEEKFEDIEFKEENIDGAFFESLVRTNKKIKRDRAATIYDDARTCYKRAVEDLERKIKKMVRDRNNMLDMSPSNATNLMVATDFNDVEFVEKDIELSVKIRNETIKYDIAKKRYELLFGKGE